MPGVTILTGIPPMMQFCSVNIFVTNTPCATIQLEDTHAPLAMDEWGSNPDIVPNGDRGLHLYFVSAVLEFQPCRLVVRNSYPPINTCLRLMGGIINYLISMQFTFPQVGSYLYWKTNSLRQWHITEIEINGINKVQYLHNSSFIIESLINSTFDVTFDKS